MMNLHVRYAAELRFESAIPRYAVRRASDYTMGLFEPVVIHFQKTPERPLIWPRWLSWMRRPTGDQEVAGTTPAEVVNIFS